jgi:hypothetical protein
MSAIPIKNSNFVLTGIRVAGIGVIAVVAGIGAVIGHDVLDSIRGDRDCRPSSQWCPAPSAVMPKDHTHDEPSAPLQQGRATITVTSSATSNLFGPR